MKKLLLFSLSCIFLSHFAVAVTSNKCGDYQLHPKELSPSEYAQVSNTDKCIEVFLEPIGTYYCCTADVKEG